MGIIVLVLVQNINTFHPKPQIKQTNVDNVWLIFFLGLLKLGVNSDRAHSCGPSGQVSNERQTCTKGLTVLIFKTHEQFSSGAPDQTNKHQEDDFFSIVSKI